MKNSNFPQHAPVPLVPQQTSGLAIISLVFGILSILGLAFCGAFIVAIICGHIALSRINRSGGVIGGRGMAIAGLALGYVAGLIAIGVLLFIFLVGGTGRFFMQREINNKISESKAKQEKMLSESLAKYDDFIGTYRWPDNEADFHVLRGDGNHLQMLINGDEVCDLAPDLTGQHMRFTVTGCMQKPGQDPDVVRFEEDEDGKMTLLFWFKKSPVHVRRCPKIK